MRSFNVDRNTPRNLQHRSSNEELGSHTLQQLHTEQETPPTSIFYIRHVQQTTFSVPICHITTIRASGSRRRQHPTHSSPTREANSTSHLLEAIEYRSGRQKASRTFGMMESTRRVLSGKLIYHAKVTMALMLYAGDHLLIPITRLTYGLQSCTLCRADGGFTSLQQTNNMATALTECTFWAGRQNQKTLTLDRGNS